jgi:hypothetical protein
MYMYISQVLSEDRNTTPSFQNDPLPLVTFYRQLFFYGTFMAHPSPLYK